MRWINVNEKYLDFLRSYEDRIPYTDYGSDKIKPFFCSLFETEEFCYITQISHAQKRHTYLKDNIDFRKIYDSKNNRLIAVVNINYMFPIPKNEISDFHKKDIESYRKFSSVEEKTKYINLLNIELKQINNMNLSNDAIKIYKNKYLFPESKLANRCFDFKTLEKYGKLWINKEK